jgi:hypothetical protein
LGEKEVKGKKRVYGLIAIILILCISLTVFISLAFSSKAPKQTQESDVHPEASTPSQIADGNENASTSITGSKNDSAVIFESVNFACNAGSPYEFTVTVKIDLSDGMNSTEAVMVAREIFEHELNATYAVKSAEADDAGVWTVDLSWEFDLPSGKPEVLNHFFDVTINPLDQTVTYSRCY